MTDTEILVIGGGIGGLTAAAALCARGFAVDVIERDAVSSGWGVGILQQGNVVRAMKALNLLDGYLHSGFGFDRVDLFAPTGAPVASVPSPRLVEDYPANVGIGRAALHRFLGTAARSAGATVRLGVEADRLEDDGSGVTVTFKDGTQGRYDIVVGADGLHSGTRKLLFPDTAPRYTGQGGWRYVLPRPADVQALHVYEVGFGLGLCPISGDEMYLFVTTAEPDNPRFALPGLAETMRGRLAAAPPRLRADVDAIRDDAGVVYRPLDYLFVEGGWHRGRTVLLGDAAHATTPHLAQGAGMAIEDSIVLAEELALGDDPVSAFKRYHARRHERCRTIVDTSVAICMGQLGKSPKVDQAEAIERMYDLVAQPI